MCGVGMGVVARSKIGSGAGEVSSTWVDVKGPDLHVCMCVCVCVCVRACALEWGGGIYMAAGASGRGFLCLDEWEPF